MVRYIITRLGYMAVTLFVVMTFTFLSMKVLPGTPFQNQAKLTDEQLQVIKEHYGLDEPIPIQFVHYLGNFFQGDLGTSFQFKGQEVMDIMVNRLGPSATLAVEALMFGIFIGLLLGLIAAIKHNSFLDYGSMVVAVLGLSIPSFVFAAALQYLVGVKWGILPVAYWESWQSHIMPAFSLSVLVIGTIARFMRTEMLEVLGQDYITTAKSKGLTKGAVIFKHSVRNALIPVVTIIGPLVVGLMTGSLVIEKIFAIPGIGQQFVLAITTHDYPMIMGVTLLYAGLFIVTMFIIDILYVIIDPRIQLAEGEKA